MGQLPQTEIGLSIFENFAFAYTDDDDDDDGMHSFLKNSRLTPYTSVF